jgi:hypothetical protein
LSDWATRVLALLFAGVFLGWAALPLASELWGAYRPREPDSAVMLDLMPLADGGAE